MAENIFDSVARSQPEPKPHARPAQPVNVFDAAAHPQPAHGPMAAAGSMLTKVSNALDVPLAFTEAAVSDLFTPGPSGSIFDFTTGPTPHLSRVHQDLASGGPAKVAENDIYFRKGSLNRVLEDPTATASQKARAQWFLKHPWVAGAADLATEFANPSNVIGGIIGRGAGALAKIPAVGRSLDEMQALSRVGNRFAGLRVAGRDVGLNPEQSENFGRTLIRQGAVADKEAYDEAQHILGGLTRDQQREVIHRMQGNVRQSFGDLDKDLDARGQQLGTLLWQITRDQLREGVIDPSKIYGREEMFPGVFDEFNNDFEARGLTNPESEEIVQRSLSGERPEIGIDHPNLTPDNAELLKARNGIINERADALSKILNSDESPSKALSYFPMRGAFNDASRDEELLDYLDHHRSSGIGGLAERRGTAGANAPRRAFRTLMDAETGSKAGIDPNWVPADSLYRFLAQRKKNVLLEQSMKELQDMGLAKRLDEKVPGDKFVPTADVSAARMFGSPTLKGGAAHQHVVNFLEEVGASHGEASAFATATTLLGKAAHALGPSGSAWKSSQQLAKIGVIANPIVHGGWNLMFQYLAAGGDIRDLVHINEAMARDAERLAAVGERGAPRSLSGGSDISEASRPYEDLTPIEKVKRKAAQAQEWNAKIVFDRAEKRYASALYQTYIKRGMNPYEAANTVRRALGDYANVSNLGIDAVMHKAFFFYPWLKTILPFWIKNGIAKPQTWNPAFTAVQSHNELAGDPNYGTGNEGPFTVYTGMKDGRPAYWSVPLPQRILGQIADFAGGALTGNQAALAKGAKGLFLNRLSPFARVGVGGLSGITSKEPQPEGVTGYAPIGERVKTAVASLGDYTPQPVQALYHLGRAAAGQEQFNPTAVMGELAGGTGYAGLTPEQQLMGRRIRAIYYRAIDSALKGGDKQRAWQYYQLMQKTLQRNGLGEDIKPEKPDETNPMPVRLPEGSLQQSPFAP